MSLQSQNILDYDNKKDQDNVQDNSIYTEV